MPIFNAPFSTSVFMPPFWVTSETVSVQENNTTVTTLDAGYVTQYSIVGGVDASKFSISGNTLSFTSAPDFEAPTDSGANNIYEVTIRATNPAGFADRSLAVTVTNDVSDDEALIINGTTHYLTSSDYSVGNGTDRQGTRTGSLITLTVPAAVECWVYMWGGGGGAGDDNGGGAGHSRGRITFQPNTNYRLLVAGGGGGTFQSGSPDGGYGGGGSDGNSGNNGSSFGNGGSGTRHGTYSGSQGGGGGGCSGLFLGTNTNTPLLIAGGGGGGSGGPSAWENGGTGGGTNGYPNVNGTSYGGGGGTQSQGGVGE
ncbi:MAG: cadherin repeat domain-containing protein, partial [Halioglobus sp.]